jgi:hypothetical protein
MQDNTTEEADEGDDKDVEFQLTPRPIQQQEGLTARTTDQTAIIDSTPGARNATQPQPAQKQHAQPPRNTATRK